MSMKGTRDMNTTGSISRWVVTARRITVVMALFAALGVGVVAVPQPAQATASSCDTRPDPLPAGFVSCWRVTAGFSLMLPLFGGVGSNSFDVAWGDGTSTSAITGEAPTHTFTDAGDYWIVVSGTTRPKFTLAPEAISDDMRNSLIRIAQWDGLALADGGNQFAFARNFTTIDDSAGAPDLTGVTSFANAFLTAPSLNANLNSWNVSGVTNMYRTFRDAAVFNGDISGWNVSNVTNMLDMFRDARAFNQPLNSWNTGNVTNMSEMFRDARAFNQPLNSWNTGSVTDMHYMFRDAQAFNQPLNSWNTGSVTDMYGMFGDARAFNQPLNSWNTGNVRDMGTMFWGASAFNQPLNSWNTGSVRDMANMFRGALTFNQPLNSWNTGSVTKMYGMFRDARAFNQPLDLWNTGNVNDMENMFRDATAFNQPLGGLNVRRLNEGWPNLNQFMSGSNPSGSPPDMTMSALNVDLTLAGWAEQMQGLTRSTRLDLGGSTNLASGAFYTEGSGSVAVAALQAAGWTVEGGNLISTTNSLTPKITATVDSGATRSFSFRLKNGSDVEYTVNPRSVLVATPTLAGASAGAVTYDSGADDGTYTFEYTAPSNVGVAAVSAASAVVDDIVLTVNGQTIQTPIEVTINPAVAPTAPTITSATPGNGSAVVAFTAPTSDGGSAITGYEYRLDGGAWVPVGSTSSPFTITGLTNGTSYQVELRAVNGVGPGPESAPVTVTPAAPVPALVDRVARVFGSDRFATSVAVSLEFAVVGAPAVYVASGVSLADAMVAGSYAAEDGGSVLFVERDRVPAGVLGELRRLAPREVVVVGGHQVVAPSVEQSLVAAGFRVRRVAGADRYATAVALSKRGYASTVSTVYVASGVAFADAMPAGVLAAIDDGPVLLVTPGGVPAVTAAELVRLRPERIVIVGGLAEVGAAVEASLRSYAARVVRVSGVDRYETAVALSQSRFDPGVPAVFVMSGDRFPDALAAVAPAGRLGGPILLSSPTCVPASVRAEIGRLQPGRIIIIGGGAVLGSGIDTLATC
jgi:surface protein